MKSFVYIVCWEDVLENVLDIEKHFLEHETPHKIINSGLTQNERWDNVGDIRYYRQFYHALKSFDYDKYDYMGFLCGDVSYNEWPKFLDRVEDVLSSYEDVGLYAPRLTFMPVNQKVTELKKLKNDQDLIVSIHTDGIFYYIHKDIAQSILTFFNIINKNLDLSKMISGWGIDTVAAITSISNNKAIICDNKHVLNHPEESSYDHMMAKEENKIFLEEYVKYMKSNNEDYSDMKFYQAKFKTRFMFQDNNTKKFLMNIEDFYTNLPKHFELEEFDN